MSAFTVIDELKEELSRKTKDLSKEDYEMVLGELSAECDARLVASEEEGEGET